MSSNEEAVAALGCGCGIIIIKLIPVALFIWAVIYIVDALK